MIYFLVVTFFEDTSHRNPFANPFPFPDICLLFSNQPFDWFVTFNGNLGQSGQRDRQRE